MTVTNIVLIITLSVLTISSNQGGAEEIPSLAGGEKIYTRYCTPCHGTKGDGKGFNAKNLDPRPANHTSTRSMGNKTDSDLYEAISGGGKAVGKSTLMPPWGNTFSESQIRSLILYVRKLCKCQGS